MITRIAIAIALVMCADVAAQQSSQHVVKVIKGNPRIRECYEREAAKNKELHGRVVVKFTIDGKGRVSAASLVETTIGNANVETCVVREVRTLMFRATGAVVDIQYPFQFKREARD